MYSMLGISVDHITERKNKTKQKPHNKKTPKPPTTLQIKITT